MKKKKEKEKSFYEREEERLQDSLFLCDPYEVKKRQRDDNGVIENEPEYDAVLARLERVHQLAEDPKPKIDPNTVLKSGAYLVGVLVVVAVELGGGLIRSGAVKFLPKP